MKTMTDLGPLDRATLRAWRAMNLVGWWLAGVAIFNVGSVLVLRTVSDRLGGEAWLTGLIGLAVTMFAAGTAGWVVGRHVYRSPIIVTLSAVLLPWGVFLLLALLRGASPEVFIPLVYGVLPATVAGYAARAAWRRRPSALRASR